MGLGLKGLSTPEAQTRGIASALKQAETAGNPAQAHALAGGVVLGCLLFSLAPISIPVLFACITALGIGAWWSSKSIFQWAMIGLAMASLSGVGEVWRLAAPEPSVRGDMASLATLRAVEPAGQAQRLYLDVNLGGVEGSVPLRLTYGGDVRLDIGARYQVVYWLAPPAIPAYPSAYDSAYQLWTDGVVGVGSVRRLVPLTQPGAARGRGAALGLRQRIDGRVREVLPGPRGAIASALMTGYRANLDGETRGLFRDSGLAHLLAISGLHLSLVAGAIFALVRALFWLRPGWSERVEPLRLATLASLIGAFGYFMISGAAIPTQRALILLVLVCLGAFMGRRALSWRLWSLALTAVLLLSPSAVFSLSTHLSFLAVAILIRTGTLVEAWRAARPNLGPMQAWAVGLFGSSFAVNFFTVPLLLITFGRAPLFGVLANLVAVPLAGVALIPLALAALILMPLGLDALPLYLLGQVIGFLIWLAEGVTSLPGNMIIHRQVPFAITWPLLLGYAALLAPAAWGPIARWQRVLGMGLIAVCLGIGFVMPLPIRVEHPDGWVIERGLGGKLVNAGQGRISGFAFDQAKTLWPQAAWPSDGPPNSLKIRESTATPGTGSIAVYANGLRLRSGVLPRRKRLNVSPAN